MGKIHLLVIVSVVSCLPKLTAQTTDSSMLYNSHADVSNTSLIHGSGNMEYERNKARVRIVHAMLKSECLNLHVSSRVRRALAYDVTQVQQEVEAILYERLTRMLIECRTIKAQDQSFFSLTSSTTAKPPQPAECQTAQNLTEYWRQDHNGSNIRPGGSPNCDTDAMIRNQRPWFRFEGAAGNMMLDKCPPKNSCGTHAGMWTNVDMPLEIGTKSDIDVFASYNGNCKRWVMRASVIRCSYDHAQDFVYRYIDDSRTCSLSFCGVTKN